MSPSALEWRPVPGRPGYEVSIEGHMRSLRSGQPRQMKHILSPDGYQYVFTYDGQPSRMRKLWVHRAVLLAFVGPRPTCDHETRHLDGNPGHNALDNLAWGTREENTEDRRTHGTIPRGERVGTARLTEAHVREIRELHGTVSLRQLGARFGVSHTAIRRAALGIKWGHLV